MTTTMLEPTMNTVAPRRPTDRGREAFERLIDQPSFTRIESRTRPTSPWSRASMCTGWSTMRMRPEVRRIETRCATGAIAFRGASRWSALSSKAPEILIPPPRACFKLPSKANSRHSLP